MKHMENAKKMDGQALIYVLTLFFLILYLALSSLTRTINNTNVTFGSNDSTQAYTLAESGVEDATNYISGLGDPINQNGISSVNYQIGSGSNSPTFIQDLCSQLNVPSSDCNLNASITPQASAFFSVEQGDSLVANLDSIANQQSCAQIDGSAGPNLSRCGIGLNFTNYNSGISSITVLVNYYDKNGTIYTPSFSTFTCSYPNTCNGGIAVPTFSVGVGITSYPDAAAITVVNTTADVQVSVN